MLPKAVRLVSAFFLPLMTVAAVVLAGGLAATNIGAGDSAGAESEAATVQTAKKVGLLMVSHGSRSAAWRRMLWDVHDEVAPQLAKLPGVVAVKSAFMEYTEPSIATQLQQLDAEGCDQVILVPLLLTVSSHSFDDIPTIIGAKEDAQALAALEAEGVKRYRPKAAVTITPLLDFSELLQENLPRRVKALSREPSGEGVVLVAYGDVAYGEEWEAFFTELDDMVCQRAGAAAATHCWCGHIVEYSREPTKAAIREMLAKHERAIVIPVLVAKDEVFQNQLIGRAIEELGAGDRVLYVPDAILPDAKLNQWVIDVTRQTCAQLQRGASAEGPRP